MGLMIGVDLVKDRQTKEHAKMLRDRIVENAFRQGIITFGCGESSVRFSPALSITKEQIDESLHRFELAVTESESEGID
jgi:4-aminobutyrate aminotransferase